MPEGTARASLINYLVEAAFGVAALGLLVAFALLAAIDAVFGGGGALLGAGFVLGECCSSRRQVPGPRSALPLSTHPFSS